MYTPSGKQATEPIKSIDESLELAKRALALRKFEQAIDYYATALEQMTEKYGEKAPEMADVYFAYGKTLLENAIAQSSVLGKEQQAEDAVQATVGDILKSEPAAKGAFLSFSGDGDDEEDPAVDLFAEAKKAADEADKAEEDDDDEDEDEDDEEGEAEPEDDFNAAWEVLDLARAIWAKQQDEDDRIKLKLAETYIALGDISLETEKFDQAITDYTEGLNIKAALLPVSSREIAEAHYKLSIVYELTSGRLQDAIVHAEKALGSVEARLAELRDALSGQGLVILPDEASDAKGKGKVTVFVADDAVQRLTKSQMEREMKELQELRDDLSLKVDELKSPDTAPPESAPELVAKVLDAELNAAKPSTSATPTVVNDLTGMVKKKKKAPETNGAENNGATKRKAEDEGEASSTEKRAKTEEAMA